MRQPAPPWQPQGKLQDEQCQNEHETSLISARVKMQPMEQAVNERRKQDAGDYQEDDT
jgi:hypothetical protein